MASFSSVAALAALWVVPAETRRVPGSSTCSAADARTIQFEAT